ncbi:MAG: 5-(carboxyamino)imidazole ribonucleotide synthase [Sumerlaeia bacterium]
MSSPAIGILGAGQLGRMLALAGYPLGLRFRFLDPAPSASTDPLAERLCDPFEDIPALAQFAKGIDVATYEFENVPVSSVRWLAERLAVHPGAPALETAQDRLLEKTFFRDRVGAPVPPFECVESSGDLDRATAQLGYPCVLKTRRFGYDGKGQRVLRNEADARDAWKDLGGYPLILEGFVPFSREVSLLAVRNRQGRTAFYPLAENHHSDGILRLSLMPAPGHDSPSGQALQAQAEDIAREALAALDYVGVLAIEFFEQDGRLLVNEMAPRVHNSGHGTIEGTVCGQFENHLRAVMGWPLGNTAPRQFSAMVNLIGAPATGHIPSAQAFAPIGDAHAHHYGKSPRPGRKRGHVTLLAPTREELAAKVKAAETVLANLESGLAV